MLRGASFPTLRAGLPEVVEHLRRDVGFLHGATINLPAMFYKARSSVPETSGLAVRTLAFPKCRHQNLRYAFPNCRGSLQQSSRNIIPHEPYEMTNREWSSMMLTNISGKGLSQT